MKYDGGAEEDWRGILVRLGGGGEGGVRGLLSWGRSLFGAEERGRRY
jgi:hypothetical protein